MTYKKKIHNGRAYQLMVLPSAVKQMAITRDVMIEATQEPTMIDMQPDNFEKYCLVVKSAKNVKKESESRYLQKFKM